jgi:methionyl-tRNA formyltransferase
VARLAFLGTPEPAALALRALVGAGHDVAIVVTRPNRRRGRAQAPGPSPVKAAALELGLRVAEEPAQAGLAGADLGIVVAYGRLLQPDLLARVPMVNLHFSLLPRWRGAAPVEWAILAGDKETGVCLMKVEEGLDTGPVYACRRVEIEGDETAAQLRGRLATIGAALLVERLADPPSSLGRAVPQQGQPTYARKLAPAELRLDWAAPAARLVRVVRVGRAWTTFRGKRLLVLEARACPGVGGLDGLAPGSLAGHLVVTGSDPLELVVVQPEGRVAMPAADWARGAKPAAGEALGR